MHMTATGRSTASLGPGAVPEAGGPDQMPDSLTREDGCVIQDEILKPTQGTIYGAAYSSGSQPIL
jgi:hypothetical protein